MADATDDLHVGQVTNVVCSNRVVGGTAAAGLVALAASCTGRAGEGLTLLAANLSGAGVVGDGDGAGLVAIGAVLAATLSAGQRKPPFWRRMIASFSLSGLLPRRPLIALQQATTFSSALVPPFATACRCSTLASALASSLPQKKQSFPCSNKRRSSCFMCRGSLLVTPNGRVDRSTAFASQSCGCGLFCARDPPAIGLYIGFEPNVLHESTAIKTPLKPRTC